MRPALNTGLPRECAVSCILRARGGGFDLWHIFMGKLAIMSYIASISVREADISQEEIIASAHKLIFGSFSRKDGGDPVRILPVPDDERDEFGIVEIDVAQSREPERLDLLKKVFMKLCAETNWGMELDWDGVEVVLPGDFEYLRRPSGTSNPVVFDSYSDEEQDNPHWERRT